MGRPGLGQKAGSFRDFVLEDLEPLTVPLPEFWDFSLGFVGTGSGMLSYFMLCCQEISIRAPGFWT